MNTHRFSAQVETHFPMIRWEILRVLKAGGYYGATEAMVLSALRTLFPFYDQMLGRDQLDYLAARKLINLERVEVEPWRATLTRHGIDLYEYRIDCEPGIARPPRNWTADGRAI